MEPSRPKNTTASVSAKPSHWIPWSSPRSSGWRATDWIIEPKMFPMPTPAPSAPRPTPRSRPIALPAFVTSPEVAARTVASTCSSLVFRLDRGADVDGGQGGEDERLDRDDDRDLEDVEDGGDRHDEDGQDDGLQDEDQEDEGEEREGERDRERRGRGVDPPDRDVVPGLAGQRQGDEPDHVHDPDEEHERRDVREPAADRLRRQALLGDLRLGDLVDLLPHRPAPGQRRAAHQDEAEEDRQRAADHQVDDRLRDREVERAEVDRDPLVLLELGRGVEVAAREGRARQREGGKGEREEPAPHAGLPK